MSSHDSPVTSNQCTSGEKGQPPDPPQGLTPIHRRRRQAAALRKLRQRLPHYTPSPRHLEIFEAVAICHKHQLEAASIYGISQQRVSKIVRQVSDWVAGWGGDQARYALEERFRLATFVTNKELVKLMSEVRFAIQLSSHEYHWSRTRHDANGNRVFVDHQMRQYPRPAALYKILFQAILAHARFSGAGMDLDADREDGSRAQPAVQQQAMVLRAEINVNPPGSSPPDGELCADNLSGTTYVEPRTIDAAASDEIARPCGDSEQDNRIASARKRSRKSRCTGAQVTTDGGARNAE
jgi:hypothetical protein